MNTENKTIDLTPSWQAALKICLFGIENGTIEGKKIAKEELDHMAKVAQEHVDMMNNFPNGFRSWMETHHEVVEFITLQRLKPNNEQPDLIRDTQNSQGSLGFYDLAQGWTNEFEQLNKGREWDGEFFEEVESFCLNKATEGEIDIDQESNTYCG